MSYEHRKEQDNLKYRIWNLTFWDDNQEESKQKVGNRKVLENFLVTQKEVKGE